MERLKNMKAAHLEHPAAPQTEPTSLGSRRKTKRRWRRADKIALWGLLFTILGTGCAAVQLVVVNPFDHRIAGTAVDQLACYMGSWHLVDIAPSGLDHGDQVKYEFTGGFNVNLFADTGELIYGNFSETTEYPGSGRPSSTTNYNGAISFSYQSFVDTNGKVEVDYDPGADGSIAQSTEYARPARFDPPPFHVTCDNNSIIVQMLDRGQRYLFQKGG
jgi:hypothetical protein